MVAESHQKVSSFSKLTLELAGEHTTVAIGRPVNKQNRCRTEEELRSPLEKRFAISCYRDDVKKESVSFCHYKLKTCLTLIPLIGYWRLN